MRLALDTNRYSDFTRGETSVVQSVHAATSLFIPFIVIAELRAGFAVGSRAHDNEAILTRILHTPETSILFPDDGTTHHYASLYQQMRRQGTPIPTNDLWIAALVIQYDLVLFTRDRHFDHLPQIPRI